MKTKNLNCKLRGLTLIEVLAGLAIMLILSIIVWSSFQSFRENQIVSKSANEVAVLLSEARSLTLSSRDDAEYGVHFEEDSATLYQASYLSGGAENKVIEVELPAEISSINLSGGGSNVVFDRLTGETSEFGSITISSTDNPEDVKIITISQTGLVELN